MKSKKTKLFRTILLGLLILNILGCKTPMQAQAINEVPFVMRDGAVVDPIRGQIFITNPERKPQAISITTGETLWSSQVEAKALAIINNKLVCQSKSTISPESVIITQLDLGRSGVNISIDSIALPQQVNAGFVQSANNSFDLRAKVVGNQTFFSWDFQQRNFKGLIEKDSLPLNDLLSSSGALRLNTQGKISTIRQNQLPSNMAQSIIPTSTQQIQGIEGQQFISKDQKNILLSKKIASDDAFNKYSWEIYDTRTRQKLGEIQSHKSYAPFFVKNDILIYETGLYSRNINNRITTVPLQLKAINLKTGEVLWTIEILDTIYRGPTPP
ncbi:hypothetical protein [Aquimarina sp. AU58]|uniref:hypothetical protein n=1 Tax=Aquimarina sp. AU58 TaxID=1874112 RepID=UPI00135A7D55|nr:hypothetical protein [Aquimarina sp. AU58]